jgi:transposase-like protein
MEVKIVCPICQNHDFIDIIIGVEQKPKHYLKCTKCFKEFDYKELTPTCEGDICNVG